MRFFGAARRGSYELANLPNETLRLPPNSLGLSLTWFFFIVLLQILVIVVLIVAVFVEIVLQPYNNKLSTKGQLGYTLLVTLTATLIATATESEIRKLWTYAIVNDQAVGDDKGSGARSARKTSVVLGLSKMGDLLRTAYIPMVFGLVGLITTAIVAGLQPTSVAVSRDMPILLLQSRNLSRSPSFAKDDCLQAVSSVSEGLPSRWFTWPLTSDAGSNITISSTGRSSKDNRCPGDYILSTFQTLQEEGGSVGYTLPGSSILVDSSAAGVPYDLIYYAGIPGLRLDTADIRTSAFGTWSLASFKWATMCVPLITKRVVSCQRVANIKRTRDRIEVSEGNCTVSRTIHEESESENGEMVAGACTGGRRVGTATLLMGATNEYASQLRDIVIRRDVEWPDKTEREFAVACDVDLTDSLSFHRVLIAPFNRDSQSAPDEDHSWLVTGATTSKTGGTYRPVRRGEFGDTCTPTQADGTPLTEAHFLTPETLVTGAASSWQLLAENMYTDGHLSTLLNAADEMPGSNYYRENYQVNGVPWSKMEEIFTLASSISIGFHLGAHTRQIKTQNENSPIPSIQGLWTELLGGQSAFESVRVGSGELWGLVFSLPAFGTLGILSWLGWRAQGLARRKSSITK